MSDLYQDPIGAAVDAATKLAQLTGKSSHRVALVMGSGWGSAADALGTPTHEFAATDLPGFLAPTVAGHGGVIRSYDLQGPSGTIHALVFLGRTHLYEGKGIEPVVHGVRTAVKAGCKVVVLTNASGGVNLEYRVGQPIIISDHISLTGVSPLTGATFVDLTDLYSKRIREIVKQADPSLAEGVYV
ncbi:MAG: purine-nucleoside phosphorylase, partial [Actinomycetes bacterium]